MAEALSKSPTQERETRVLNGWFMLPVVIALFVAGAILLAYSFINGVTTPDGDTQPVWSLFVAGLVALGLACFICPGFFTLQPNEARVLILFGSYRGTVKQGGFCWAAPSTATALPRGQRAYRSA